MEKIRIQKIIADSGYCSRRKAEEYIKNGKVRVNGHPCSLGDKALPGRDLITVGEDKIPYVKKRKKYYIMLNKPRGYVTTMSDELDRKCVTELLDGIDERVYPVGRLDRNSEGLLLLTNDGDFANNIMHPSKHIGKTYRVTVRSSLSDEQVVALSEGVVLDGKMTAPAIVNVLSQEKERSVFRITIFEGRNRQIRRMCEELGLEVARLRRVAIGPLRLGMLKSGEYRELTAEELRAMRNAIGKEG